MKPCLRRLSVHYAHRPKGYSKYPVIRFGGAYLHAVGFRIGDKLDMQVSKGNIVITKRP